MSKVHIYTLLNPVTHERAYTTVEAGKPLSAHINVPDDVLMLRNGLNYDDEILHDGDVLNLISVPKGGEQGKSIGRTAIVIGATLLAASFNPFAAGSLGASLFVAGAQVAASLGANALIPPSPLSGGELGDNAQFQRLGSLTGTRNRVNPYGVVPKVYGKRKIFPPMSARPFTEIVNNEQFLNLLFTITEGPCQLSVPKIGDTVIGTFDSSNQFTSNGNFTDIQIDVAESPDLYSNTVSEASVGVAFSDLNDTTIRTTEPDTERISCDFVFPQGLFGLTEDGRTVSQEMVIKLEIRETGTTTWQDLTPTAPAGLGVSNFFSNMNHLLDGRYNTSNSARETYRAGFSVDINKGQYDIRVTRLTDDSDAIVLADALNANLAQVFSDFDWTVIRSMTYQKPTNMPGVVQLAMRIKATDQLTGVLDNFSVLCESRLATYDGSSWSEPTFDAANGTGTGGALTSNPAWVMAELLTGSATARPIAKSRLDAASFKNWADNCVTEGRECNLVQDRSQTVLQSAGVIGSAGRGSLGLIDGVYKIIQDTEQTTPVQHFTPRNSWNFSSTRSFPDVPNALRVNFVNPAADWETDEGVVYDDDYSSDGNKFEGGFGTCAIGSSGTCKVATEFETADLQGVTNWDQAWKEGRYRLAEMQLRPERYRFTADVENIVCNRGDMVRMSHDVTLWGQVAGRITGISGSTLTLDELVTMESGKSYNIRVRTQSGGSEVKTVTTDVGTTNSITVNNTTNLNVGDLFSFGLVNVETQELKVLSIEPQGDLTAIITAVDAAPEIYDADTGTIPDFDSNISDPVDTGDPGDPYNKVPPAPSIVNVRSEGNLLTLGANWIPQVRIVVSYQLGSGPQTETIEGRFKKQGTTAFNAFGTVTASTGFIELKDPEIGDTYILQIRARNGLKTSDWVESAPHVAGEGITLPPPADAIGELVEDYTNATVTQIKVKLDVPVSSDKEYWIINRNEQSLTDRFAGVYPIVPASGAELRIKYGPGLLDGVQQSQLPIDEQVINAPKGSLIYKAPGQDDVDDFYPDFSFIDDTLEVAADTLRASMDLIADGVTFSKVAADALQDGKPLLDQAIGDLDDISDGTGFAKVSTSSLDNTGLVILSATVGDLDDVDDGTAFGRVDKATLTSQGLVLMTGIIGDLDDVSDGINFQRVQTAQLTATGLVLLDVAEGDIDDIDDGTNFAKVKATSVSAGEILLTQAVGDLDDLADGTNFQKVASTQLTAGGIVLLSVASGDLDDVDDGTNFGKINVINIDAATGRITLLEAVGNLDDIDDGTFKKVSGTNVTTSGLVTVSGLSGDFDDLEDGADFAKLVRNGAAGVQVDNAGFINIFGPDGQTVINQGTIDTNKLIVGDTVFIGNDLSGTQTGNTDYESGGARVLIGNAQNNTLPYVRAQYDADNYVQMVGVGSTSGKFFRVMAGGAEVLSVDSTGLSIGGDFSISNPGGDYTIDSDGITIEGANFLDPNSIKFVEPVSGDKMGEITTSLTSSTLNIRTFDSTLGNNRLILSSINGGITLTASNGKYIIRNLPTSASGLQTDDLYTQTATQLGGSGTERVICIA